jgi:hypothetical protein
MAQVDTGSEHIKNTYRKLAARRWQTVEIPDVIRIDDANGCTNECADGTSALMASKNACARNARIVQRLMFVGGGFKGSRELVLNCGTNLPCSAANGFLVYKS